MFVKKSILVSKGPNQFPNCWFHDPDENDNSQTPPPSYDLELTKTAMDFSLKLCSSHKNVNLEEDDWESKLLKYGWSPKMHKLFNQTVKILDYDKLARLANVDNKRYEAVQRRAAIDKSVDRMRKVLATVAWDTTLVQWLHGLMMEFLPPSYLAAYLDIMQTLKHKLPSLVDKMIFWKPGNVNQDLLAPILKKPWQPALNNKYRKLPGNALLVVIPSAAPRPIPQSSRIQKLYTLFPTLAPMLPIQVPINSLAAQKQSLQIIAEQTVSVTRTKIQELKAENPDRRLILIGLNSAAAVAMQVALVEQVSGVVCFGFSYNTVHGVRGQADDHFLELNTPTLFLVGQNAARSNEEEIETFREKISAPTSMVVVGSADDFLRVSKKKRRLEGVTQEMVDNMIVDEIADFATKCLQRPMPARPKNISVIPRREIDSSTGIRKRKPSGEGVKGAPMKTQKLMRPTSTSDDVLDMAIQSILPDPEDKIPIQTIKPVPQKFITTSRVVPGSVNHRMKVIHPQQQFSTLKPQPQKFITIGNQKNFTVNRSVPNSNSRPSTPTQFVVANRVPVKKVPVQQSQQSFSPTKYTIVRSTGHATPSVSSADLAGTNIFDMPIVFADSEGNIDEEASDGSVISVNSDSPPRPGKQIILKSTAPPTAPTFTVTKNKNILIQKPAAGKMFMINGTVIGKQLNTSNIILPKANIAPQLKMQKFVPGTKIISAPTKKIEILNNTIIKPATNMKPATSFVNLADAKPMNPARLSLPIASTSKNQIIIKSNALKPYTGTQILPSSLNTKQLGNLTVKRLNVVPTPTVTKVIKKN